VRRSCQPFPPSILELRLLLTATGQGETTSR
jgi:hypothetical protein